MRIRIGIAAGLCAGALLTAVGASAAPAGKAHTCRGTMKSPGVLTGIFHHGVLVKGFCLVDSGPARVTGDVTITHGSTLAAIFGHNDRSHRGGSSLTVHGNVIVQRGGAFAIGCNPKSFPCADDSQSHPTLTSRGLITGSLLATDPLGIVVHSTRIAGSIRQTGGGGGLKCVPEGPFTLLKTPVYSDYEDSSVGGSVTISRLTSCWLGVARVHIRHGLTFSSDELADPDAIEILSNVIGGNLACSANSHVWDSAEFRSNPQGALYPRTPEPNRVHGHRSGQCMLASPATQGGSPGPGAF